MASTGRIGGVLSITVDGQPYPARGNFTVMPSSVKREGIAGQDYVHGYIEKPVVPSIKGEMSTIPGLSTDALQAITDSTIIAQMANGTTYVLQSAWTVAAFEIDSENGKLGVEFQGLSCDQI